MTLSSKTALAVLIAGALAACGSDQKPSTKVTKSIGAGGGTVSLASGPTLNVPAGALPANTDITIAQSSTQPPSSTTSLSPVYDFQPSGLAFAQDTTVSIPLPGGTSAGNEVIYWGRASTPGTFDSLETRIETVGGVLSAVTKVRDLQQAFLGRVRAGSVCDTYASVAPRLAAKAQACAGGAPSIATGAQCAAAVAPCTAADNQILLGILACWERLPNCTLATVDSWFQSLAACDAPLTAATNTPLTPACLQGVGG